jgi:hypothetical protein
VIDRSTFIDWIRFSEVVAHPMDYSYRNNLVGNLLILTIVTQFLTSKVAKTTQKKNMEERSDEG